MYIILLGVALPALKLKYLDHPRQETFIRYQSYNRMFAHTRQVARDLGVERVFQTHGVNIIISPADGFISTMASAGGKYAPS